MREPRRRPGSRGVVRFRATALLYLYLLAMAVPRFAAALEPTALESGAPSGPPELVPHPSGVFRYPCDDCEAFRILSPASPYMRGADVEHLQEMLIAVGVLEGPADGIYGPLTWRAISAVQAQHGMKADGVVNLHTWALIQGLEVDGEEETAARPPPAGFTSILIDAQRLTLTVFADEEVWGRFSIAAGKAGTPTPLGEWRVVSKGVWARGFGTRWMGLSVPFAAYGIHGTSNPGSIGSNASHGCIRMRNADVEKVYPLVSLGTPVKIVGTPRTHFGELPRLIRPGYVGSDVMVLQAKLKELGLYHLRIDGRFEGATLRALREFQWSRLLPVTGLADKATRGALGMP